MYDALVLLEWLEIAARWLHVITAIAWIGSSFYFVALDLGLRKTPDLPPGAYGEEWQVHGGGFYHIQKYLVAPARLPEHLIWFKWESYATWLSGFAMLVLVYYLGADLYLIDAGVMELSTLQAIALSLASLAFGWLVYDRICKTFVNADQSLVMVALFLVLVGMSYFYTSVFSGRAALLHLGAFTATIMSANVFMIIIPNQKIVVADLKAGKSPDPKYGKIAKQRSTHNNYLTLPVLFLMLSTHYPLVFATEFNWIIASLVFLMGVSIRHWFNSRHAGKGNPHWTWCVTVILFLLIAWLSTAPMRGAESGAEGAAEAGSTDAAGLRGEALLYASAPGFDAVVEIIRGRCAMCHAAEPVWEGMGWAPKGVILEEPGQIAHEAGRIVMQSGFSHAMPPGNLTFMEEEERAQLVEWYRAARARGGSAI